ncbi:MAG TPA: polyphosphate kinase 2 family protein [Longilinea sp.]|nr:polyphosphate kinase 2 family protein [Longilinea sp.]
MAPFSSYRVKPGKDFRIDDIDPDNSGDWKGRKEEAKVRQIELTEKLDALQEQLYAEGKHKVLVVIQGMDASGKDGTIRKVFEGINPQGVRVASFKSPSPLELSHDYLWRVHQVVPAKGQIVIFNRSHYEDVLIVRVHKWIDEKEVQRRLRQIRDFEQLLADEGTTILKFHLRISKEEQKKRFIERIETPEKNWKFNPGDLGERTLWKDYMNAYEDAIRETSTEAAPWYVVPADHEWYRDLLITSVLVDTLENFKMTYPKPSEDLTPYKKQLEEEK